MRAVLSPAVTVILAAGLAGCADAPPPRARPEAPLATLATSHYAGSPLSGPRRDVALQPRREEALAVRVRWLALERLPGTLLRPLGEAARLVLDPRGASPLLAVARLTVGGRAGAIEDPTAFLKELAGPAGWVAPCGELFGALPPGVTAELGLSRDRLGARSAGGEPLRERAAIAVHRLPPEEGEAGALEVALAVEAVGTDAAGEAAPRSELVLLEPVAGDRLRLALLLPSPLAGAHGALAALVEVSPAPAPGEPGYAEHGAAFARCVGDLAGQRATSAVTAAAPPTPATPAPNAALGDRALAALRDAARRRGALVSVASAAGAPACADAALALEEPLLARLAADVRQAADAEGAPRRGPGLTWLLERATLARLAREVVAEPEAGPPALGALLIRHVGALALYPGTLLEALEAAEDAAEWEEVLALENAALLDDGAPAVRVRAHAWLAARGRAPADYDPLAPAAARAHALAAAAEAADAAGAAPAGAPQ